MRWGSECLAPNMCVLYCSRIFIKYSLLLLRGGFPKSHIICVLTIARWFFLVLFRKSTKNFGLAFLRVSGRRGCLKRPLRASDLFGVLATIPTVPPFTPQNPTAEIVARTPMLCRFAERESVVQADVLRPRSMEGARFLILRHFTSKLNS